MKDTDWQAHHFDTVSSTMDTAKDLLQQGIKSPFYVLADKQSSGRGRYARQWASPKGNLYLTLVTPLKKIEIAPFYAYITAISVLECLQELVPEKANDLTLKWPNDFLLNSKKLGGVLLEVQGDFLIIGIGLNIKEHPKDTAFPATHLCSAETRLTPKEFATVITHKFDQWQTRFEKEGFAPLRKAWLKNRDPKHQNIAINPSRGNPAPPCQNALAEKSHIQGRFHDLDEQGNIVLESTDNKGNVTLRKYSTGDVFFI